MASFFPSIAGKVPWSRIFAIAATWTAIALLLTGGNTRLPLGGLSLPREPGARNDRMIFVVENNTEDYPN